MIDEHKLTPLRGQNKGKKTYFPDLRKAQYFFKHPIPRNQGCNNLKNLEKKEAEKEKQKKCNLM